MALTQSEYRRFITNHDILAVIQAEPKAPSEVSRRLGIHQKAIQRRLVKLQVEQPALIGYRMIGRYHIFWLKTKA